MLAAAACLVLATAISACQTSPPPPPAAASVGSDAAESELTEVLDFAVGLSTLTKAQRRAQDRALRMRVANDDDAADWLMLALLIMNAPDAERDTERARRALDRVLARDPGDELGLFARVLRDRIDTAACDCAVEDAPIDRLARERERVATLTRELEAARLSLAAETDRADGLQARIDTLLAQIEALVAVEETIIEQEDDSP